MKPALLVVSVEVSPNSEAAWNAWHEQSHIPDMLRLPGLVSCRKWRELTQAEDGWARYVNHYELISAEALQKAATSDEGKRLRADSEARFGSVTRVRIQSYAEVARFEVDSEPESAE